MKKFLGICWRRSCVWVCCPPPSLRASRKPSCSKAPAHAYIRGARRFRAEAYAAKEKEIIDAIGVKPVPLWLPYGSTTIGFRQRVY